MADRNTATFKSYLRTITIIHIAFISGLLFFSAIVYFQLPEWHFNIALDSIIFSAAPTLALTMILLGNFIFKKRLVFILEKKSLKQRFNGYQSALLLKYAFIEGATFICMMLALYTANLYDLGFALLVIAYFISIRPTKIKVEKDLQLTAELKDQLEQSTNR